MISMSYSRNMDVIWNLVEMTSGATCLAGTELIRRKAWQRCKRDDHYTASELRRQEDG